MQDYLLTHLYWISLFASICALLFAYVQAKKVLNSDEGTDRMKEISRFVRTGAAAFLKRQYRTVIISSQSCSWSFAEWRLQES